jgi:hypothetical protein
VPPVPPGVGAVLAPAEDLVGTLAPGAPSPAAADLGGSLPSDLAAIIPAAPNAAPLAGVTTLAAPQTGRPSLPPIVPQLASAPSTAAAKRAPVIALPGPFAGPGDITLVWPGPNVLSGPSSGRGEPSLRNFAGGPPATARPDGIDHPPGSGVLVGAAANASSAGSSSSGFFFVLLFAIAGIAVLLSERVRRAMVRRRPAVFVSLLERPG